MSIEANDLGRYALFALVIVGLVVSHIYYWRSLKSSPRIFAGALFSKDFYIFLFGGILSIASAFIAIAIYK
jgi:hypothetical protein